MNKMKIGVIPAAGPGTRMGYLSHLLPKCMFPLYDRPILHHVIQNMVKVGVENVVILVNYQSDKIEEYLSTVKTELSVEIRLVKQENLLGIGHAIMLARQYVSEPFIAILGDDCTISPSLSNITDTLFREKAVAVEGVTIESNSEAIRAACCLELSRDGRIIRISEKPQSLFSDLRGCGVYAFDPEIFDCIESTGLSPTGRYEISNVIENVARRGRAFGEFIEGVNINVNSSEDLLRASLRFREHLADEASENDRKFSHVETASFES